MIKERTSLKKSLLILNRVVTVVNGILLGLGSVQTVDVKNWRQKRVPLWLNFILLLLLGFIMFCQFYAPYLRDQAA